MTARPQLPGMPLTPEHVRQRDSLLATLTTEEALWISGYLAGFARHPAPATDTDAASARLKPRKTLLILYGSETGHSEALAQRAEELAQARGLEVRRVDMEEFRPREIHEVRLLLVITSTHGEGDPPLAAAEFFEFMQSRKAPKLDGLKYAVLGLGDSSYEKFCQAAKDIDQRLEALGAERLHARAECDVDFETSAAAWIDEAVAAFARELAVETPTQVSPVMLPRAVAEVRLVDQKHPFPATILDSVVLNGRGSGKETRHIEISLAASGVGWEPGDSLGILPENDPDLVAELIATLGLKADESVAVGAPGLDVDTVSFAQALGQHYEITTLTPGFIQRYAEAAGSKKLRALAKPGKEAELRRYMDGRQIIDVVNEFPLRGLGGNDFVAMLRSQQPRLYSLASSAIAYPEEAHLTVAVARYESHGRQRRGVASTYLAERRSIDDTVRVYVSSNKNFRLPLDPATPLIMIGPGTGIAPFRAFLQEREATGAIGRNWLFFGDRCLRTDFLYQTEWLRLIKDGRLTRMDVAFSRDQDEKVYVQHRLLEHGREIYSWLEDGASLYVCGDASRMALDVHAALTGIVVREGRMSPERAEDYMRQLQREKRYQRDVY